MIIVVLPACMCTTVCPQKTGEDGGSSGTGIVGGVDRVLGTELGSSTSAPSVLTASTSFQDPCLFRQL